MFNVIAKIQFQGMYQSISNSDTHLVEVILDLEVPTEIAMPFNIYMTDFRKLYRHHALKISQIMHRANYITIFISKVEQAEEK